MSNASNKRTSFPPRLALTAPLLLALSACGQSYELGEMLQPIDLDPPAPPAAVASVLFDELTDADAPAPANAAISQPVGDVDGDGKDDWINRTLPTESGRGSFRLIYGGERLTGAELPDERLGPAWGWPARALAPAYSVAPAGDVDADGHGDLLVSFFASYDELSGGGYDRRNQLWATAAAEQRAYLVYGGPRMASGELELADVAASFEPSQQLRDSFSSTLRRDLDPEAEHFAIEQRLDLAALGDIDADGFDDWAYTYTFAWRGQRTAGGGSTRPTAVPEEVHAVTYLFYGGPTRLAQTALGARAAKVDGLSMIQALGDVDGDGLGDFSGQRGGATYLVRGARERLSGEVALSESAGLLAAAASEAGELANVRPVGDLDADGFDDLLVERGLRTDAAAAYLFYGSATLVTQPLLDGNADAVFELGSGIDSLNGLGDWNGDGHADLSAVTLTLDQPRAAAIVFPGSIARYSGAHAAPPASPARGGADTVRVGQVTLSPIGDIDGDDRTDVLVWATTLDGLHYELVKFGGPLTVTPPIY